MEKVIIVCAITLTHPCDGKSKESKKVIVPDMELTDWERNEEETDKAYSKLF